jgi:hypothetical protein
MLQGLYVYHRTNERKHQSKTIPVTFNCRLQRWQMLHLDCRTTTMSMLREYPYFQAECHESGTFSLFYSFSFSSASLALVEASHLSSNKGRHCGRWRLSIIINWNATGSSSIASCVPLLLPPTMTSKKVGYVDRTCVGTDILILSHQSKVQIDPDKCISTPDRSNLVEPGFIKKLRLTRLSTQDIQLSLSQSSNQQQESHHIIRRL